MPVCKTKRVPVIEICAGDLRHTIQVQTKSLDSPDGTNVDFDVSLTKTINVRAMIETVPNESIFDGTNVEQSVTHKFYTRFIPGITFQNWVKFRDQFYAIVAAENLQEENKFMLLRCNVRGDIKNQVNLA